MTLTASQINKLKHAPATDRMLPAILQRWSPRAFADKDVPSDDLRLVFEAARWAPSSFNEQPWRYIAGRRGSETYTRIIETMTANNQAWAGTAPVLMVSTAKLTIGPENKPSYYALHDLGAASAYMALEAANLGLALHQMAGYDREKTRQSLGVPAEFEMGAAIALGYQGELHRLTKEEHVKRETAPRTRKGLDDIVFSAWGQPFGF
jgi:nitroreductase